MTTHNLTYNGGFIVTHMAIGLHRVTHEQVAILVGEGQLHVVVVNPSSRKFGNTLFKLELPSKRMPEAHESEEMVTKGELVEPVSGVQFDEDVGTFVSFNSGHFRMYEPMHFQDKWQQDCNKRNNGIAPISIVCSAFSKKQGCYVVGGQQGNIKVYDATSKSFFSENTDVHSSELIRLYFIDDQS